uniref:SH2 domain containing 3C n=1 Tax=Hippocampus comes TaxID=109280 RepID=A0A3Q2YXK1_HIPCM
MTERCSLWSALSAAACCFYRGSFMQVQFSKEKYLLESPPEKLRKELEEELKLSPADIRSHGWYHGHIPREQYVLESESFDSVPELVRFYASQRKAISQTSGVHIYCPVSRTLPLRYLEATFALSGGKHGCAYSPSNQRGAYIKRRSVTMMDGLTTEKMMPHPSTIHHHKDAMRNCAMSMDQIQEYRCPLSPVGETPMSPAYCATRQRAHSGGRVLAVVPPSPIARRSSDPQLSPSSSNNPPEHPANISHSAHSSPAHHPAFQSHSSETAGSYCDLRPCPAGPPKPPTKTYVERLRVEEEWNEGVREEGDGMCSAPRVETASLFRPIARILGVNSEMQRMMGVSSGLELLTLPHGHQLRLDLLERFYTMSIMTAVDLLGCTGSTEERAALLHKTIQLAAELKSNLGNMFGFAAVMRALELPQISRLEQTWVTLRQRHTEGAILYEKKLKPFLKNLNDGKLERGLALGEVLEPWESAEVGVDVVMHHLEAARIVAHHGAIYRSNVESKLQFQVQADILEIFQTEFQMRLLWGCRGSEGSQLERYEKFDKVLTALSHKLEPPVRHSEL